MPFFAPVTPPTTTKSHTAAHTKKQQTPQKKSSSQTSEGRTLLPMTGDSRQPLVASVNRGNATPLVQGGSSGNQKTVGPVKVLIPNEAQSSAKTVIASNGGGDDKKKLKWVHETYFDAGAEDLIGTFTTQIIRYGVRYEQHEIHVYGRNETLDTRGTNLPYQSIVAGTSAGAAYRYWLPDNKAFVTVSDGRFFSGNNKNKDDFRIGAAGYYDWKSKTMFTDIYADAFYIDLQKDTFMTARIRSGMILKNNVMGGPLTGYGVMQVFNSGKGDSGTTNRIEGGFGVGYVYAGKLSFNVELRAGYAYRGIINNRTYLNPMFVISGSL